MSAFPDSGHSDHLKLSEIRGRFRPEADGAVRCNRLLGGCLSSNSYALAMNQSERVDEIRRVVVRVDDHKPLVVPVLPS